MKKIVRWWVFVVESTNAEGVLEYSEIAGPFKNKTAAEWWTEHNITTGAEVLVKQLTK